MRRSCTWKGSLEKALQAIYPALAVLALGLGSHFPLAPPHRRAHPPGEGAVREAGQAGCRSHGWKTRIISGSWVRLGWEYSSFVSASMVGRKSVV